MLSGFSITLTSLTFVLVLFFYFRSKQHIESVELKIFERLLNINIIGLVMEMLCNLSIRYMSANMLITTIINKLFLTYFIGFMLTLFVYVVSVCIKKENYQKNSKSIKIGAEIAFLVLSIIDLILPIQLSTTDKIYSYGPAVSFIYIISFAIIVMCICLIIKNIKNIRSQNYIPLIFYIASSGIVGLIQSINPELTLSTVMESLTLFIMYFTIENPDVKMIKQVEAAKEAAEKANQAKSDFLSAMSHEIRTPLNAIVGFSESLKEETLTPSQLEEVNDIIDASNTLLETVNGILDISKIEANKIEIINETYSTEKLFRELVKLSEARLGDDKPIEFKYHLAEDTPKYLYGDHIRIKQVILNFLTNAIKYTKRGYIEFDVRNICRGNTCRLIIKVEDSGIGIKKESIDRLFDKFDRLDNENSTIEGTGLGLAITKRLVELMHGKIIVQSIYGKGSQFTIVIDQRIVNDAIAHEVEEVKEENTTINNDLSSKKVLIVDDNLMNLKVAARLLKTYNLIIEQADSGFKCLDLIGAGNKYDLILLDDMMPKMSGKETFKKLKEDSSFNIPVVILTANAITGMKEEYLQFGFNDYLAKPIEKDELNRVIKKFLDK
ncbi:MAG: response regulator [Firmicutes bacterium]|nr:response regulator [Bacillota bacterium]